MMYVKYINGTENKLTIGKVYDVISKANGTVYTTFAIADDLGQYNVYTLWTDGSPNSFEDVTLEYTRDETIKEILE